MADALSGLANVLREASAALARLGGKVDILDSGDSDDKDNIAEAALALEQVADTLESGGFPAKVPSLSEKLAAKILAIARGKLSLCGTSTSGAADRTRRGRSGSQSSSSSGRLSHVAEAGDGDEDAIEAFVSTHQLDAWIGEALLVLSPSQRFSVIKSPLKVEHARNPNGVVMSRVKAVTPVEQRIQIFIKVNDLGEGVIDRLSTLTPEQCEAVMESGMKIQRASNPSAVAMSRISDTIRNMPADREVRSQRNQRPRLGDRYRKRSRSQRNEASRAEVVDGIEPDVKHLMQELGLEIWCGEVLRRLSLSQRQAVVRELGSMHGVRNPSGVVMSRVKHVVTPEELLQIFIELNSLDQDVEAKLWKLTPDQRAEVLAPGIYVQNVRNTSTAVRSRIGNVLEGRTAMTRTRFRREEKGRASQERSRSRRRRHRHSTKSEVSRRRRRRKE